MLALVMIMGMATAVAFAGVDDVVVDFDYSQTNSTYSHRDYPGRTFPAYFYDGNGHSPVITVKDGDKVLTKDVDYTITYFILNMTYGGGSEWAEPPEGGVWNGDDNDNIFKVAVYGAGTYESLYKDSEFAIIARPSYHVFFNKNDGSDTFSSSDVLHGDPVDPKNIPAFEREGYELEGWYTDAACSPENKFDLSSGITRLTNLYAKWTELVTSVEVTMPEVFEGEGYQMTEGWGTTPSPKVTLPAGAKVLLTRTEWVVPGTDELMGFSIPTSAATFKKGDEVYIFTYLDCDGVDCQFIHDKIREEHDVEIKINGGEYVNSYLYPYMERATGDVTGYTLIIASKVIVQGRPAPDTGDNTAMILLTSAVAVLTLCYLALRMRKTYR